LLAGAAGSWLLYRNHQITIERYRTFFTWLLAILRGLAIACICLLLLNPLVKTITRKLEKPIVAIAIDNSKSILSNKDSAFYRKELYTRIKKMADELGSDYEVQMMTFGSEVKKDNIPNFAEKQTNLSGVVNDLYDMYDNQNMGALILASDGIYNQGVNPIYEARKINFPIYTIALGDTTPQRDVKVKEIRHNEIAYLGNTFPLYIEVEAFGCSGEALTINVARNGVNMFSKQVNAVGNLFQLSVPLTDEAKTSGLHRYTVTISKVSNEISFENNTKDAFVEVLEGKQKVLLVANAPHPDISAIRQSVSGNKNYELKSILLDEVPKLSDLKSYSICILHQLPSTTSAGLAFISNIQALRMPILYITGQQSNYNLLNNLKPGVVAQVQGSSVNDASAVLNTNFSLFSLSDALQQKIKGFPPLKTPFGSVRISGDAEVLATQQVGYVKTNTPLIVFNKSIDAKCGVILGEGLWRWRLAENSANGRCDAFDELITKTIQYLAVKADKRLFKINNSKRYFYENEPVRFDAEVYNESYELINSSDVEMEIRSSEGKKYQYTFSKNSNTYTLDAGLFGVGNYSYTAKATVNGKPQVLNGNFSVLPLQAELNETVADHRLLASLANESKGAMYYLPQLDGLRDAIRKNEEIRSVNRTEKETQDLIHYKWMFFIIITSLGAEWLIRKWNGSV
jgi:hypothetical protein